MNLDENTTYISEPESQLDAKNVPNAIVSAVFFIANDFRTRIKIAFLLSRIHSKSSILSELVFFS